MSEYKYKSPIEIIQGEMEMRLEGEVMKAVQNVGINVNKDELLKALAYDRDQYNKGYHDAEPKVGHWIEPTSDMIHNHICGSCEVICSSCNETAIDEYNYCPNCGARMKGE